MAKGDLEGKVAIVTGAGSTTGIGQAIAGAYVRAGASVVLLDVNERGLEESVKVLREIGGRDCALGIATDVGDPRAVAMSVDQTIAKMGGLHILVNNAGIWLPARFWEISPDTWQTVRAANLDGPIFLARAVVDHMMNQAWGRIIGVTTSLDTTWSEGQASYGATKAGHESLVSIMAAELQGSGVTANVLVPGTMTHGEMTARFIGIDFERKELREPDIMQAPAVWLASDASSEFNGRRIIAYHWDESLAPAARLEKASAPAAWPQLGPQFVPPGVDE